VQFRSDFLAEHIHAGMNQALNVTLSLLAGRGYARGGEHWWATRSTAWWRKDREA